MKTQVSVMKKLNGKFRALKESNLFRVKQLNKRAAHNGYSWRNEGVRSEIKDDYILILNIPENNENIAIAVNYTNRADEEAVITASKAIMSIKGDNYNLHFASENIIYSKPFTYKEFSEKLRIFIRKLPDLSKYNVVEAFSEIMGIVDLRFISEEEQLKRTQEAFEKLHPIVEKTKSLEKEKTSISSKLNKARNKASKEVQDMAESKELAELEKRVQELRGIIKAAQDKAFAPAKELSQSVLLIDDKIKKLNENFENEKNTLKKTLTHEAFIDVIKEVNK